jgi:acetyl esterase
VTDRYFARILELMASPLTAETISDPDLAARVAAAAAQPADYSPPAVQTENTTAPGPNGDVNVRVYRPVGATVGPLFVWCHGGGWVGGDLEMPEGDFVAREICARTSAVVVSVDYRLAIQGVHYPVPNDDVVAAIRWARDTDLGADPSRFTVGGASAGANLVAGAVVRLRDEGDELPNSQLLIYPLVHPQLPQLSEDIAARVAPLPPALAFAPEILVPVVENYLGGPLDSATPYAMAALAPSLNGLPPTLIINCEYDALRASGEAFAEQLAAAGVPVHVTTAPNVLHGHLNQPWLPETQDSLALMAEWVSAEAKPASGP